MGLDVELMVDSRQFEVKSKVVDVNANVEVTSSSPPVIIPIVIPTINESQSIYRAITCSKIVNYHAIVERVEVTDKGSKIATENQLYDAETGEVVVTRANNEFNKLVYQVKFPAWWAYDGMGPAGRNTGLSFKSLNFHEGIITNLSSEDLRNHFVSGDEILIVKPGIPSTNACLGAIASSTNTRVIWAFDKKRMVAGSIGLTETLPDFLFIDENGKPYTRDGVTVRIMRSGRRNLLGDALGAVTMMTDPIANDVLTVSGNAMKIIQASAQEYSDRWRIEYGVLKKYAPEVTACGTVMKENCSGVLETGLNPYRKGLIGNFRPVATPVLFTQRTNETVLNKTDIARDGFVKMFEANENFEFYWGHQSGRMIKNSLAGDAWIANTSLVTLYNKSGQVMEQKDALNKYTSAQYNPNGTPNAITQNAQLAETFYESFDNESNHVFTDGPGAGNLPICYQPRLEKIAVPISSQIAPIGHTGKKSLLLPANVSANAVYTYTGIQVNSPSANPSFEMSLPTETQYALNNPGAVIQWQDNLTRINPNNFFGADPQTSNSIVFSPSSSGFGLNVWPHSLGLGSTEADWTFIIRSYVDISEDGVYQIQSEATDHHSIPLGGTSTLSNSGNVWVTVTNVNTSATPTINHEAFSEGDAHYKTYKQFFSFCALKGRYEIRYTLHGNFDLTGYENNVSPLQDYFSVSYQFYLSNFSHYKDFTQQAGCQYKLPLTFSGQPQIDRMQMHPGKKYWLSAWTKVGCAAPCTLSTYENLAEINYNFGGADLPGLKPTGPIIDGWQKIEGEVNVPANASVFNLKMHNKSNQEVYMDDLRIHPFQANMASYVFDPVSMRLLAELDENNYATLYEYDEEGTLIRKKVETEKGIKTIQETRSYQQKRLNVIQ
jgi:hypothetical protein